jgi:hypothetical protein
MTISLPTNKVQWLGNGATTTFSYPFAMPAASEAVLIYTDPLGNQAALAPGSYTITGIGQPTAGGGPQGGTVTYPLSGSPIPVGSSLTLMRALPLEQPNSFTNQGGLWPLVVEASDDNLAMQVQQIAEQVNRALLFNPVDNGPFATFPIASKRALQLLGFDANGNPMAAQPSAALVSGAMQAVVAAATSAAALGLLGGLVGVTGNGVTNDAPAILTAVAARAELWFPPATYVIGSNLTIGNGKKLRLLAGAVFAVATGVTLTINGLIDAPRNQQIFSGPGSVVGLREVYPEWWGAQPGNSGFDSQPALAAAHSCIKGSLASDGGRPTIWLGAGVYYLGATWVVQPTANCQLQVIGDGTLFGGTRLAPLAGLTTGAVMFVQGNTDAIQQISDWVLSGFGIVAGAGTPTIGLQIGTTTDTVTRLIGQQMSKVEDVFADGFTSGIQVCHARLIKFERCSVWNNTLTAANTCINIFEAGWFTGDMTFEDCQVVGNAAGASRQGVYLSSTTSGSSGVNSHLAGIRFHGLIAYNCDQYFTISCSNGSMISDIWLDDGSQMDAPTIHGIYIQCDGAGSFIRDLHIEDIFLNDSTGTGDTINVLTTNSGSILDVFIRDNWIWQSANRSIIVSAASGAIQGLQIRGNEIADNNNTAGAAILVTGAVTRFSVSDNISSRIASAYYNWFVQIGAGTDYFAVQGNVGAGIAATATVSNLSSGTHTAVANNV